MSLMKSIDIPLGSKMPKFELKDPLGKVYTSEDLMGKNGLLIYVTCNHCPYAKAVWKRLISAAEFAKKLDINTVAINPNIHPNYPEDSPSKMLDLIKEYDLKFPYLVDETQEVSKALQAQCTPDIYLYDSKGELFYHGRVDDNWQNEDEVTKEELKEAIMLLFTGKEPPKNQKPSMGCSIKWRDTILG
ncbi:MAG: thioredoxin family protein [Epsilonproteobacteria bacterium]|nr:thioredoxin family protein [Campylobacterota bacterium]